MTDNGNGFGCNNGHISGDKRQEYKNVAIPTQYSLDSRSLNAQIHQSSFCDYNVFFTLFGNQIF